MAVVVLTFTGSEEEITSGIPMFMTITSNVPATIYFTLDDTTPTTMSPIYIDTFEMPDNETSVALSAFGIDSDGYAGPILTQIFATDSTSLDRTRHTGLEGVVVDRFVDPTNIVVDYGQDSFEAFSDIPRIDLRELHSEKGRFGIAAGTLIEIETPDPSETPTPNDDNFQISSSVSDPLFNPFALTIINDHREDNFIQVINRPFGSMRRMAFEREGQHELGKNATYVSGGFLRRLYGAKSGCMASYYFDHNTNRWIMGLQQLPQTVGGGGAHGFNQTGQPLVFQWIERGRHSTIPI